MFCKVFTDWGCFLSRSNSEPIGLKRAWKEVPKAEPDNSMFLTESRNAVESFNNFSVYFSIEVNLLLRLSNSASDDLDESPTFEVTRWGALPSRRARWRRGVSWSCSCLRRAAWAGLIRKTSSFFHEIIDKWQLTVWLAILDGTKSARWRWSWLLGCSSLSLSLFLIKSVSMDWHSPSHDFTESLHIELIAGVLKSSFEICDLVQGWPRFCTRHNLQLWSVDEHNVASNSLASGIDVKTRKCASAGQEGKILYLKTDQTWMGP